MKIDEIAFFISYDSYINKFLGFMYKYRNSKCPTFSATHLTNLANVPMSSGRDIMTLAPSEVNLSFHPEYSITSTFLADSSESEIEDHNNEVSVRT